MLWYPNIKYRSVQAQYSNGSRNSAQARRAHSTFSLWNFCKLKRVQQHGAKHGPSEEKTGGHFPGSRKMLQLLGVHAVSTFGETHINELTKENHTPWSIARKLNVPCSAVYQWKSTYKDILQTPGKLAMKKKVIRAEDRKTIHYLRSLYERIWYAQSTSWTEALFSVRMLSGGWP